MQRSWKIWGTGFKLCLLDSSSGDWGGDPPGLSLSLKTHLMWGWPVPSTQVQGLPESGAVHMHTPLWHRQKKYQMTKQLVFAQGGGH